MLSDMLAFGNHPLSADNLEDKTIYPIEIAIGEDIKIEIVPKKS